jgi:hypothetical protein
MAAARARRQTEAVVVVKERGHDRDDERGHGRDHGRGHDHERQGKHWWRH